MDEIAKEFKSKSPMMLAVDGLERHQNVRQYLAEHPRSVTIVLAQDTNPAAMYNAQVCPVSVVIDRDGNIAGDQRGARGERGLRTMPRHAGLDSDSQ